MEKEKLNKFSVPLGLLDYVNPILYTFTMVIITKNLFFVIDKPYNIILLAGAVISVLFGLVIPTGKVIVGLGIIKFRMPVALVFSVNAGIFITGLMLLKYVINISLPVLLIIFAAAVIILALIYIQSKKINTVAVLTGAIGYLMIYISLIILSVKNSVIAPVILYSVAIILFVMLCGVGIKANLKNPRVHWLIEISNVTCQFAVALGTYILFK